MDSRTNLLIGVLILSSGFAGCAAETRPLGRGADSNSTAASRPIPVTVYEAQPSVSSDGLLIPAAITVEGTAVVLSQRDGAIGQLNVQEGARVAKGALLARLSGDDDLRAQLRQAGLEVDRSKVEEKEYEALIKVNRNELEREKTLAKDGLASERDVERAQFKLDSAVYEYEGTKLATQTAQAKVEVVKVELEKSIVRAPIAGIVTQRYVKLGTSVVKNDKLFEISQLAPLEVKFQLPQTERGGLGPGSIVALSLVDSDRIIAQARVRRIDPVADPASNTLGYWADLIGRPPLMPGSAVNVRVPRAAIGSTVWIARAAFPAEADLRRGTASTLFVVEGGKCASRVVWVNAVEGDRIEIVSGLTPGERVILAPPAGLKAGDVVEIKN